MKNSYRFILSSIALGSALVFAQQAAPASTAAQPAAAPAPAAEPAPTAQATPAPAAEPAPAPAAQATPAPAAEPAPAPAAQATPAPAAESVAQPTDSAKPAEAAAAPADSAAPIAVADSTAAPADSSAPADSAAPVAVADSVNAATADTAKVAAEPSKPEVKMLTGKEISGDVHGMLSVDESPYLVTGNITIDENKALYIQPGVTLLFMPGTGLYVNRGQLMASGNGSAPVVFRSAKEPGTAGDWKGIYLTGEKPFNLRGITVQDAEVGIAIEKGNLNLQSSKIASTSSRGIYTRDGEAIVMDCEFTGNKGVGLHAANYAMVNVERSNFSKNNIALLNSELANTIVLGSKFQENEYGVMGKENNLFYFHETNVSNNNVGAAGIDILDPSVIASVSQNNKDFGSTSIDFLATLPPNPEIPGVDSRPFDPNDKIGVLTREAEAKKAEPGDKAWTIMGNAMLGGKYHYVRTRTNHGDTKVIGNDTLESGDRYKNVFQVPGFGAEASAYLYMQSADGKTIEFNTDITGDSWNHFSPNPVTLSYTDERHHLVLGDLQKTGGEIYMSGLPIFGVDYTLSLLKNHVDAPLFELNGFFGEAKRSMVPDDRHPYIYKNYIEDGTAQAQRIAYGGSFKWAPVRRFDAKFGAIYANDELHDPLIREGASNKTVTADPMIEAFTMYADGNWLFFPGDIELNGQIAVGHADTTDVFRERAINQVFDKAGLEVNSYTTLRKLMQNSNNINSLSHAELVEIFGESTVLRDSEMKDSLRSLIKDARDVQRTAEDDRDDGRVLGENWGSQNIALSASLNWNIYKTRIYGRVKYVGEDFYSAGSDNQLADSRQFNARLEQEVFKFWNLGLEYQIDVENAASGSKTNLFGLNEGSRWGLFSGESNGWLAERELENDRTKYIHSISNDHTFDINKNIRVTAGYDLQYQRQYRNNQLHGDYILEDGIYNDDWFKARKDRATSMIVVGGDTTLVDSARWAEYNSLSGEDYLASKFLERIYKHTIRAGVSVKAFKTTFKADGRWTFRIDASEFLHDDLIEDMDLSDETWSMLGYYYGGADYFEHTYPISATTFLQNIQNRFALTPRFKSYKRDNMEESEISISDEFEIGFLNRFLILGVNAEFRYMTTEWEEADEKFDESETDLLGGLNLRVNHTKHFYSEWYTGGARYMRPDDRSSDYTDIYGGVNLNYIF